MYKNISDEYIQIISDILNNSQIRKMIHFKHHYFTSCFKHSLEVSYISYIVCKKLKLDYVSAARAGLLHDFFLYDWHQENKDLPVNGKHAFAHPKIALINSEKLFDLNEMEKDIIVKHMWPVTLFTIPKYKESFIITLVDKYSALRSAKTYYGRKIL